MKTTHCNGEPYDLENLLNGFWARIETLDNIAQIFRTKEHELDPYARVLAAGIVALRDDWDTFEEAVRAWDTREHETEYVGGKKAGAR